MMTSSSSPHPTSTSSEPTGVAPVGPAGPGGLFTGPPGAAQSTPTSLRAGRLVIAGASGAVVGGAIVFGLALGLGQSAGPVSAGVGAAVGLLGPLAMVLAIRPWRPRGVQQWPFLLLAVQAASCLLVIALAVLLYFSAPQGSLDQLALVAGAGASFIGSWVGMVRVIGACLRDVTEQQGSLDSSEKTSGQ